MFLNQLNGFVCLLCPCSSCRRLHQFWKSCRESRSSWKVSSSSLYLILNLRRAADERRPLSCVSQSSTPSWILEETRISAARFLPPGFVLPERRPGTWKRGIEAVERHRTAGECSGAQTERVHWCDQSSLRWSGAIAGSVTSSCSSWPSLR